jgi:prevent-host-death family protein
VDDDTDTVTVTELRSDPAPILERLGNEERPVIVTRRGDPAAVLLSPEGYQRLLHELELLRALALGELESAAGEGSPLGEVLADCEGILEAN